MCLIAHDESDFACAHDIIDFMYGLTLALSYLLCLFDNSVDLVDIPAARIAIVYQYTEGENTLDYRRIKQMHNGVINVELIKFPEEVQSLLAFAVQLSNI